MREILEANVARIVESFKKRSYSVTSARAIRGLSGISQQYDLSVANGKGEIVLDVASGPSTVGPETVVAFFAKTFDIKPQRPILVCIPALNHDAQSLVTMYEIGAFFINDVCTRSRPESSLMGQGQVDRVSVDRHEFEAFLSENQDLVDRHEKLLSKVKELTRRCEELDRLQSVEQVSHENELVGNGFIADAAATMRRLRQEAKLRQYG